MLAHSLLAAVGSSFGPIIQPLTDANGNLQTCAAGWGGLVSTVTGLVGFAISLGIVITVLMAAYAGFLWVTNPINPENRSKGRDMLINAAVGLLLVLSAWLIVNTILVAIGYTGGVAGATQTLFTGGDICIKPKPTQTLGGLITGSPNVGPGTPTNQCPTGQTCSASGVCSSGTNTATICGSASCTDGQTCDTTQTPNVCVAAQTCTPPGAGGQIATNVCNAANAFRGTSTANAPGTNNGLDACAWSVGQVVQNAGYAGFSSSVATLESQLTGGRGSSESQSSAVCGDIVVEAGDHHVGICLNAGCSQVISNSSSNASFTWVSGPDFSPSYSDGIGRFYRLTS